MKYRLSILSSLFLLSIMFISLVFATNFTANINPNTADSGLMNKFLNFTIINSGPGNITQVNITLYSGLTFVINSNGIDASNVNFINISGTSIGWSNTTPQGFVNTTQYFWFNVSIPKTTYGTVNFNISTNDTSGNFNSTNVSITVERTVWSSPKGEFYVKPIEIFLNWTNLNKANISLFSNTSWEGITIELLNDTTTYPNSGLTPNYTQGSPRTICQRIPLLIQRIDGSYNNTITSLNSSGINVTLINIRSECYPGRYWTEKFTIANSTNKTESANITIYLDIPISTTNTLINTTGRGWFSGSLPLNATTYQSFYFNATNATTGEVANATGIVINITSSQDVDIFLFDVSGNLRTKSINKTATSEWLIYNYLPSTSAMWEIRIYGNNTSAITYNGNISFTTLNAINTSSTQSISLIDFGIMNATTNTTFTLTLRNEGNLTLSNVEESKEFYYVKRFSDNTLQNFTILVPDSSITNRIRISLNWTGASNYSFNLYNQSEAVVASSMSKYVYANRTGAMQEEYDEIRNVSSSSGFWKIQVINNTNITNPYTVTAHIYVNASKWVVTNYTNYTTKFFNRTGNPNYTTDVQTNFTVPSNALNGTYEGHLQYLDGYNSGIRIPIKVDVTTPMLVVNNTMDSTTFRIDENYGTNLTRVNINFNISNPGNYNLDINFTDSGNLSCYSGSCSGYNATFVYNTTSTIPANDFRIISANITFNSSLPKNTVYSGWIKIYSNSTNSNLTAHPYQNFTLNLRLNLTDLLDIRVIDIRSADYSNNVIENSSRSENITIMLNAYYLNGTGPIKDLILTNFTSVWLQEKNVTTSDGSTGNLSFYAGSDPVYCTASCPFTGGVNNYYINASVPANRPGGLYNVHVVANYTRNVSGLVSTFSGVGINGTLIINNTGLHITTPNSTSISLSNSSTYVFVVNVSNYGPVAASSATITFSESCGGYSVSSPTYSGCPSTSFAPSAYNTSCLVSWTITAGSSAASACTGNILGTPSNNWFNPNGINVSVTVTAPSGGTSSGTGSGSGNQLPTYVTDLSFTKAESLIIVKQNSTNTTQVAVKNSGNKSTQYINFSIEGINSTWYTLNSTLATLAIGKAAGFLVTFKVGDVESKDYSGNFKANSTDKSITSSFTLRVTPAPAKQVEINETLALYRLNFTKLGEEINQSKKSGVNVTLAEQKYNLTKTKLEQAESYIKQGDYFSANQLLSDIKSLLDDAWTELNKAKESKPFNWKWVYIGIGIVVVVVGAYLFWPTKVEPLPKVQVPIEEQSVWDQLKKKWNEITKKMGK